jgi:hypothetical protein
MNKTAVYFLVYYVFCSFVSGMPAPDKSDGKLYLWAYGTLHTLAANASNVFALMRRDLPNGPVDPKG